MRYFIIHSAVWQGQFLHKDLPSYCHQLIGTWILKEMGSSLDWDLRPLSFLEGLPHWTICEWVGNLNDAVSTVFEGKGKPFPFWVTVTLYQIETTPVLESFATITYYTFLLFLVVVVAVVISFRFPDTNQDPENQDFGFATFAIHIIWFHIGIIGWIIFLSSW